MKTKYNFFFLFAFITVLCNFSCGNIKKTDAEYERENWIAGFSDSIKYYQDHVTQIDEEIQVLNSEIQSQLNNFEVIKKPREVTGYYLLKNWENKIPFTSTGIYARINENENLELIATLSGQTFNQISVGGNNAEFYSKVMPHDQAFNYRHERFNTVCFSGGKTDTIIQFIADNQNHKINIRFLEGKLKYNFVLPENEKNMITQTWNLYNSQQKLRILQKDLWVSSKKIETFRRFVYEHTSKDK